MRPDEGGFGGSGDLSSVRATMIVDNRIDAYVREPS